MKEIVSNIGKCQQRSYKEAKIPLISIQNSEIVEILRSVIFFFFFYNVVAAFSRGFIYSKVVVLTAPGSKCTSQQLFHYISPQQYSNSVLQEFGYVAAIISPFSIGEYISITCSTFIFLFKTHFWSEQTVVTQLHYLDFTIS